MWPASIIFSLFVKYRSSVHGINTAFAFTLPNAASSDPGCAIPRVPSQVVFLPEFQKLLEGFKATLPVELVAEKARRECPTSICASERSQASCRRCIGACFNEEGINGKYCALRFQEHPVLGSASACATDGDISVHSIRIHDGPMMRLDGRKRPAVYQFDPCDTEGRQKLSLRIDIV